MAANTKLTREAIEDALEGAPRQAASETSIQERLGRQGIDVSLSEVREFCEDLVNEGVLEIVDRQWDKNRYRLTDTGGE